MRTVSRLLIVSLCGLMLATPGCATILGFGAAQPIEVVTNPEGATILLNGAPWEEKSPTTVYVNPKMDWRIEAELPDGSKGGRAVNKKIRIVPAVCDGLFTLAIGLVVDYLNGALFEVEPRIVINLGKAPPPTPPSPPPTIPWNPNDPNSTGGPNNDAPCAICGEPRGDQTPCPHCGME